MLSYYLQSHQIHHPLNVKRPLHNTTNDQRLQPDLFTTTPLLFVFSPSDYLQEMPHLQIKAHPPLHLLPSWPISFVPPFPLRAILRQPRRIWHAGARLRPKIQQKPVARYGSTGFLPRPRFEMIWRWCMVAQHKHPSIYIGSGRKNKMLVRAGWRVCCTFTEKPWAAARHRRVLSRCPRVCQRCFGFSG